MQVICDRRKAAAAASLKGTRHHLYEDAYRMLPNDVPLVKKSKRGELFGVFDGIGSASKGKEAADVIEEYDDIALGAKALVQRSRAKGSQDDITALLIEIEEEF